jgi:hypothetical protein
MGKDQRHGASPVSLPKREIYPKMSLFLLSVTTPIARGQRGGKVSWNDRT